MNLFSDRWIPTDRGLVSLGNWGQAIEVAAPPITRLAIVRLLMAIDAWGGELSDYAEWFDLATAFQVDGLPAASARSARDIINMTDGNGVAWSPLPEKATTDADLAQALVTAYFCDRGGLKARVEGLPISAQLPPHMGRLVRMKRGSSIVELIDNNPVKHDSDYQPPWVTGMIYPEHKTPRDELELLLWPWRRLQIHGDGITIAPGAQIDKAVADPWVVEKASLKHLNIAADDDYEVTALVLNQAMPVACWVR